LQCLRAVHRILIAEDDDNLREALREALTHEGFAVRVAADAREACRAVEEQHPDAIISDIHMPGHGHTVARKGREEHIPVILISGVDDSDAHDNALAAGAFAYLRKPVEIRHLRALLDRALNGHGTD